MLRSVNNGRAVLARWLAHATGQGIANGIRKRVPAEKTLGSPQGIRSVAFYPWFGRTSGCAQRMPAAAETERKPKRGFDWSFFIDRKHTLAASGESAG